MNVINQAPNYISSTDRYELVITVNITCMMVLASVYLSVSSSLPSTPVIKPVEVWLLYNLSYPFFVIIINVVLQVSFLQSISFSFELLGLLVINKSSSPSSQLTALSEFRIV